MPETQTFKNHAKVDPLMHFFVFPALLINVIVMIVGAVNHRHHNLPYHVWLVMMSIALAVLATKCRVNDLKGQDRLIRLEEQIRYAALLSPQALAASKNLTVRQIVALRFASDTELPPLISRALAENLDSKQIKQSIVTWRPDNHRV